MMTMRWLSCAALCVAIALFTLTPTLAEKRPFYSHEVFGGDVAAGQRGPEVDSLDSSGDPTTTSTTTGKSDTGSTTSTTGKSDTGSTTSTTSGTTTSSSTTGGSSTTTGTTTSGGSGSSDTTTGSTTSTTTTSGTTSGKSTSGSTTTTGGTTGGTGGTGGETPEDDTPDYPASASPDSPDNNPYQPEPEAPEPLGPIPHPPIEPGHDGDCVTIGSCDQCSLRWDCVWCDESTLQFPIGYCEQGSFLGPNDGCRDFKWKQCFIATWFFDVIILGILGLIAFVIIFWLLRQCCCQAKSGKKLSRKQAEAEIDLLERSRESLLGSRTTRTDERRDKMRAKWGDKVGRNSTQGGRAYPSEGTSLDDF